MSASLPVTVEYIDGSTVIDITNLLEGLTWSGDLATAGRSVTINIRNTAEGDKPIIDTPKLGRRVQCYKRGKRFFVGYIFDVQKDSNGSVTLEAHDSNVYLAKNKDSMKFSKKKASQIVKEICSKYGIAVGQIDDTGYVIPTLIFRQKTLFEMIHTALTETRKKTNKIYIVGNENGKLTLKERKTQTTALVISDGTNIFSATHSENMEDLRNSVKVTGKSGEDAKGAIAKRQYKVIGEENLFKIEEGGMSIDFLGSNPFESEYLDIKLENINVPLTYVGLSAFVQYNAGKYSTNFGVCEPFLLTRSIAV